jgi:phage-related protein
MKDAWENVNAFYQNPGAVSDRALVIAFAKILDPTSVVRESESAAIANSGAFDEGMKALLQNALQGTGNLPPEIRTEIVSLSRTMYANKFPGAQQRVDLLKETARRAGLPEDLVFPGTLTPPSSATPQINNGGTIPAPLSFVPAP